jgi:predicted CopG family antitoxin
MQKKLTLSINAEIYEALHKMAGKRKIGRFIENLVRPYIASSDGLHERTAPEEEPETTILSWPGTDDANAGEAY